MPIVLALVRGAAGSRRLRRSREASRDITAPLRNAEHAALAQPRRRVPTCASSASRCRACWRAALGGRSQRASTASAIANMRRPRRPRVDERRLRLRRRAVPRLRRKHLAGRCARRRDRPRRRRPRHRPCRRAVLPAGPPRVWLRRPSNIVQPSAGARAGRRRPDAARRPAVRRRAGVRRVAQPAGAGELFRRHRRRGRGQCPAFHADQLDPVRRRASRTTSR